MRISHRGGVISHRGVAISHRRGVSLTAEASLSPRLLTPLHSLPLAHLLLPPLGCLKSEKMQTSPGTHLLRKLQGFLRVLKPKRGLEDGASESKGRVNLESAYALPAEIDCCKAVGS